MIVFAMLGALMFVSYLIMQWIPNVHILGMFIVTFTVVYRAKALIPIYVYVFLSGLIGGFAMWWIPYLYVWSVLWAAVMLLPKNMPLKIAAPVYMAVSALHGLLFGVLYAPVQALMFGFNFQTTVKWVIAGLPYDAMHALGNLAGGVLIVPLVTLLCKLERIPVPIRIKKQ